MAPTRIDELVAPQYLDALSDLSLEDVRFRRGECTEVETCLSYMRRLVQGRLDIVLAERQRRQAGGGPETVADLVGRLPEILGDRVHAPGMGRLSTQMVPGELDDLQMARLEEALPARRMSYLHDATDAELDGMTAALDQLERDVSTQRRALHDVLDRLQEEVVRRYKTGEANVDSLLG
jgi:hypothetical protein